MFVDYDWMQGTLGNIHMFDLTNYPCVTLDPREWDLIDEVEPIEFLGLRDPN